MTKREHTKLSKLLAEAKPCQHKKNWSGVGGHPIWWCPECGALSRGEEWNLPTRAHVLPEPVLWRDRLLDLQDWTVWQLCKRRRGPFAYMEDQLVESYFKRI